MTIEFWALLFQGATFVAVCFAAFQLMFHSRHMHRDLEMVYVNRYWELMDMRSPVFVLTRQPSDEDQVVIFKYLQVCEDEIDLRSIARVTDNTWAFWAKSIHAQVTVPAYAKVLGDHGRELFPSLSTLVDRGPQFDPLAKGFLWRKVHGL